MAHMLNRIGDMLDRCDAAGWILLLAGVAVVSLTVLAPAWLDVRELDAQYRVMHRRERLLEMQHRGYVRLTDAVRENDPLLMQRIAQLQLNVRPAGAEPLQAFLPIADAPAPSVERWVQPWLPPIDPEALRTAYPDTRLVRLVTGPTTRPWVLAFGGWLILLGLMINPERAEEAA